MYASLPNDQNWRKFQRAIANLRKGGQVCSDEGSDGEFYGGIDSIRIWRGNGGGISIDCSWGAINHYDGWRAIPELNYVTSFEGSLPSVDDDGSVSFYIFMIGSVYLYPNGHEATIDPKKIRGMRKMHPRVFGGVD
jgi:hypothetical protein